MSVVLFFCIVSGSVFAGWSNLSILNDLDRYSYPIKYVLAKDSLIAIRGEDGVYTIYPKYTFKLPLRFVYKIHPGLCKVMKEKGLGSLKNPFNKNLALMPKFKKGVDVFKKDGIAGSKIISFKNLDHLEKTMNRSRYVFFDGEIFKIYLEETRIKYDIEFDLDRQINKKVKCRILRALNRFRYSLIHYRIPSVYKVLKRPILAIKK